jgi:thioredoxin-like negative regulator of GroEL
VSEEVKQILNVLTSKQHWYVITETWCGDSAQNLPIIAKIVEASAGKIQLTILMRDKNPEWMNRYLTNGAKSVPKLIAFDEQENELFTWGPRPEEGMVISRHWQANKDTITKEQFHLDLHTFYAHNKGLAVQSEIAELLKR